MSKKFQHRGYKADLSYSEDDELFVGRVLDIDALILFSADSVDGLKKEFEAAVDAYLEDCEHAGVQPDKPYKGSFNVRIGSENHRRAALIARDWNVSLNDAVRIAVEQMVDRHKPADMITLGRNEVRVAETPYDQVVHDGLSLSVKPAYTH